MLCKKCGCHQNIFPPLPISCVSEASSEAFVSFTTRQKRHKITKQHSDITSMTGGSKKSKSEESD